MGKWYQKNKLETKDCLCGCGQKILRWKVNMTERFYVFGHQKQTRPISFREAHRKRWLGSNNPMWNGGITVKERNKGRRTYPKLFNKLSKVLLESNPLCSICGDKSALVHHIDEDTYNNQVTNLKVLCKSCHTKVHLKY